MFVLFEFCVMIKHMLTSIMSFFPDEMMSPV
jgi:hypothetical protein